MKNILVVAAHPDDEILGCGGTMAAHARHGDRVHILILAEGITSRDARQDSDTRDGDLRRLAQAARQAGKIVRAFEVDLRRLPDNRLDSVAFLEVVKTVEKAIEAIRPAIVYTHHGGDLNIDHRITHRATVTACRPYPGQPVRRLLFFEVASSTEWGAGSAGPSFVPNWFQDITPTWPSKKRALEAYKSEMRSWPHPRSHKGVEYLARWRGASVGVELAEAFMLGRNIRAAGKRDIP